MYNSTIFYEDDAAYHVSQILDPIIPASKTRSQYHAEVRSLVDKATTHLERALQTLDDSRGILSLEEFSLHEAICMDLMQEGVEIKIGTQTPRKMNSFTTAKRAKALKDWAREWETRCFIAHKNASAAARIASSQYAKKELTALPKPSPAPDETSQLDLRPSIPPGGQTPNTRFENFKNAMANTLAQLSEVTTTLQRVSTAPAHS